MVRESAASTCVATMEHPSGLGYIPLSLKRQRKILIGVRQPSIDPDRAPKIRNRFVNILQLNERIAEIVMNIIPDTVFDTGSIDKACR